MSVPNHSSVVRKLFDTGLFNLKTHEGQAAFVDVVVSTLHGLDENFGHIKKKPGQTAVHGHAEDATLYKFEDGTAQAVDFIGGAGGPNPQPAWGLDSNGASYKHSEWLAPTQHGTAAVAPPVQPPAPTFSYPDENTAGKAYQARVKQAYIDAKRPYPDPNDEDQFRHFQRYGYSAHEMPEPKAADKHIAELRQELGV